MIPWDLREPEPEDKDEPVEARASISETGSGPKPAPGGRQPLLLFAAEYALAPRLNLPTTGPTPITLCPSKSSPDATRT